MKKIVIIGDEHCRGKFKKYYNEHCNDEDVLAFICTGDYFDPYEDFSIADRVNNFLDIIKIADSDYRVKLLLGNHDMHYLFPTNERSRLDYVNRDQIHKLFMDNLEYFLICVGFNNKRTIVSHAGISKSWMQHHGVNCIEDINDMFEKAVEKDDESFTSPEKLAFSYNRMDGSGWGDYHLQPPTWIRPDTLVSNFPSELCDTQIVGHTRTDIEDLDYYVAAVSKDDFKCGKPYTINLIDDDGKNNNKKVVLVDTGDAMENDENIFIVEVEDNDELVF